MGWMLFCRRCHIQYFQHHQQHFQQFAAGGKGSVQTQLSSVSKKSGVLARQPDRLLRQSDHKRCEVQHRNDGAASAGSTMGCVGSSSQRTLTGTTCAVSPAGDLEDISTSAVFVSVLASVLFCSPTAV